MTTQELERLIEGQTETQSLDFKGDIPWDEKKLAKDFLAMSNVQDGGLIIVGVKEEKDIFEPVGVSEDNLKTYKYDLMKDQLASYSEPAVQFRLDRPKDTAGRHYLVITIYPFIEFPVLSKKDIDKELKANTIYYRSSSKRPQSAPIGNLTDLQNIIERSAINLMNRRRKLGYTTLFETSGETEKKAKDLAENEILKKIKSRGYWTVYIEPLIKENLELTKECYEIVAKSQVMTDWYYPIVNRGEYPTMESGSGPDFYQTSSDYGGRKQDWRMYTTGIFVSYDGLVEDWFDEDPLRKNYADSFPAKTNLFVSTSIIHFISAAFSFANRLALNEWFIGDVKIQLELHNIKGRKLYLDDSRRNGFYHDKKTLADFYKKDLIVSSLELKSEHQQYANKMIIGLLDIFNYHPPADSVLQQQKEYLKINS